VEWRTDNGKGEVISRAYLRSSEVPDGLRGLNASLVLADEPGKWINQAETWQQIRFILRNRVDPPPRCVITGTPPHRNSSTNSSGVPGITSGKGKRPVSVTAPRPSWSTGTPGITPLTWTNNRSRNSWSRWKAVSWASRSLPASSSTARPAPSGVQRISRNLDFRITEVPELEYIGVAVDPASGSKRPEAAETGIIIGGRRPPQRGSMVSRGVVLEDRTTSGKPGDWGKAVVRAYHDWGANEVIAEANQGGEMVRHVIQSVPAQGGYPSGANVPVVLVHASVGKTARAEPIQALDEAGRIQHMIGLEELERQMLQYLPGKAGQLLDRVDARVWLLKKCIIDHDSGGDTGPLFHGLAREPFQYLGVSTGPLTDPS
jgi:phage terminase large subunit-like protein